MARGQGQLAERLPGAADLARRDPAVGRDEHVAPVGQPVDRDARGADAVQDLPGGEVEHDVLGRGNGVFAPGGDHQLLVHRRGLNGTQIVGDAQLVAGGTGRGVDHGDVGVVIVDIPFVDDVLRAVGPGLGVLVGRDVNGRGPRGKAIWVPSR